MPRARDEVVEDGLDNAVHVLEQQRHALLERLGHLVEPAFGARNCGDEDVRLSGELLGEQLGELLVAALDGQVLSLIALVLLEEGLVDDGVREQGLLVKIAQELLSVLDDELLELLVVKTIRSE